MDVDQERAPVAREQEIGRAGRLQLLQSRLKLAGQLEQGGYSGLPARQFSW